MQMRYLLPASNAMRCPCQSLQHKQRQWQSIPCMTMVSHTRLGMPRTGIAMQAHRAGTSRAGKVAFPIERVALFIKAAALRWKD
eukprot:1159459-Pelagomonas_calceolata.AAC.3